MEMMNRLKIILPLIAIGLLAACRTAPIYNVHNSPVTHVAGQHYTIEQVQNAIDLAGVSLGWRMDPVSLGHTVGTLYLRDHTAVVDITYNANSYNIDYKDSRNLNHHGDKIHKNYNGWVHNLDKEIQLQLNHMGSRKHK
jgi:hypothetical protein